MSWQPPVRDMNPREMILSAAVRDAISRHPDGHRATSWQDLTLAGVRLRLSLTHAPHQSVTYAGRAALMYAVAGEAVEGEGGYRCEGSAILDLKTRAFLNVECALIPVGRAGPGA
ncbi:hypothetical protein [Xanthobacter variabilis]|uniref:hypothetical protein n=1 Tax=Xanthobacter variabilis TaxID=3119932 RepID=UPI00372A37C8